jgi:hypothetical protein
VGNFPLYSIQSWARRIWPLCCSAKPTTQYLHLTGQAEIAHTLVDLAIKHKFAKRIEIIWKKSAEFVS